MSRGRLRLFCGVSGARHAAGDDFPEREWGSVSSVPMSCLLLTRAGLPINRADCCVGLLLIGCRITWFRRRSLSSIVCR